jgi:hypothetical protein
VGGKVEMLTAGKGVMVPIGATLAMGNDSESATTRVIVASLLPVRGTDDLHVPATTGPKVFATSRRTISNAPAVIDVIESVIEYDPGFRTPNHVMNELHLFTGLAGVTMYRYVDGGSSPGMPAESMVMDEGRPGTMGNETQTKSSFALIWLATPGRPLTTAVSATQVTPPTAAAPAQVVPAAPKTGGAGLIDRDERSAAVVALLGALVLAFVVRGRIRLAGARRHDTK